jgi:hypothetical protein
MRNAYLWSQQFNTLPISNLLALAKGLRLNGLMVSYGSADKEKFARFVLDALKENIVISPMFSPSKWIYAESRNRIKVALNDLLEHAESAGFPVESIHLDVEPQILPEWETQPAHLLDLFVEMLRFISATYGHRFAIDVSLHYGIPIPILTRIKDAVGSMYVMTYGTQSATKVTERLREEIKMDPDSVLALRATDFKTRTDVEYLVSKLTGKKVARRFAFFDLDRLCKLPK